VSSTGTLAVVGTPIGNLEDASPRLGRVLGEAELVVCEDTRVLRRLASGLGIRLRALRPLRGPAAAEPTALDNLLRAGALVALVSDAGMPNTSDPGAAFVARARSLGARVMVVPGPSAATAAMALWPRNAPRYRVAGFLARTGAERERDLALVVHADEPSVIFEAPHRLERTLADFARLVPERTLLVAKELTKLHERSVVLTCAEGPAWLAGEDPRGEWVLVVDGAAVTASRADLEAERLIDLLAASSLSLTEAAHILASALGQRRSEAYQALLARRPSQRPQPR